MEVEVRGKIPPPQVGVNGIARDDADRRKGFPYTGSMSKLVLDLHPIFRDGKSISQELGRVIDQALEKRIRLVEIIPGKGSGQLRRRVIRFLHQPHIKEKIHRMEIDENNHGRMFLHFKHQDPYARR